MTIKGNYDKLKNDGLSHEEAIREICRGKISFKNLVLCGVVKIVRDETIEIKFNNGKRYCMQLYFFIESVLSFGMISCDDLEDYQERLRRKIYGRNR